MNRHVGLLLLVGLLVAPLIAAGERGGAEKAGNAISAFRLKDTVGKDVSLADFKNKKAIVVVFVGTECPVNNFYMRRLVELNKEFEPKGVQLLGINSNNHDSPERVAEHAKTHGLTFPVLKDADHAVADLFKAERTPEAFVLDAEQAVCYRGRIDDQYGIGFQRIQPTRRDLAEALNEVLAGKPVSKPKVEVAGCIIGRSKKAEATASVTFTKDIARIFQKDCQECHRPGQIGPFSLMTYEKARGWSDTIREVVTDGRMPPWHADPRYGKFSNDRRMTESDKKALLTWIDEGCPKGDEKDLPPPREFTGAEGWSIGKPDMIFTMKNEVRVPAKAGRGGVPYYYSMVPTNFEEDVWVQAAEAKPGNRAVVHHIIVYGSKLGPRREGADRLGKDLLVATAPGDMPLQLPPGVAKRIPKGGTLVFQMHYTPNGVETTDRSSVGLILSKQPPKYIAHTRAIVQHRLRIPPGEANYKAVSKTTFDRDAVLLSFMPHMHLRGKSFEYKVIFPDGKEEILLSVPKYDFNWQTYYHREKPLHMPAGTQIECTAYFDNSEGNPSNPDPHKTVRWGEQTWEEMMIGFVDYYFLDEKPETTKTAKSQ